MLFWADKYQQQDMINSRWIRICAGKVLRHHGSRAFISQKREVKMCYELNLKNVEIWKSMNNLLVHGVARDPLQVGEERQVLHRRVCHT